MEGPVFRKAFIFVMIFQGPFKKGVMNILENLFLAIFLTMSNWEINHYVRKLFFELHSKSARKS